MKSLKLNSQKIEILVYAVVWFLAFSIPYFGERTLDRIHWNKLSGNWVHLVFFLLMFLVNVYVLVPKLLFEKKYSQYFISATVVALIVMGLSSSIATEAPRQGFFPQAHPQELLQGPPQGPPPPELSGPDFRGPARKPPFMVFADNLIISILLIGAGTASKLVTKWLDEEKLRKDMEKEQLKTNLALLRHQVSPHFFMNTLNNIHALIDINPESAKDAIVRLSTLMRYLLYDSAQSGIPLKKEIEFISSFISLMQLRFSDKVEIDVVVPDTVPDIQIPPMLFISFLENAFKHGVSYNAKSYIFFELRIEGESLHCLIKNSKHPAAEPRFGEYSGLGLENIRKSLELLYGTDYSLKIEDGSNEYAINLVIPL